MTSNLIKNIHEGVDPPSQEGETVLVKGQYDYWHYKCDGVDDRGWGCGYRTLQTISSWIHHLQPESPNVPSIRDIQETLVKIEDKDESFIGSRDWIGSMEVCYILDEIYNVSCKLIHLNSGRQLKNQWENIRNHLTEFGGPIMMGGDKDCSSKGIFGIHKNSENIYLLIVDPHCAENLKSKDISRVRQQWVTWQSVNDFLDDSFYNLCLPQIRFK